MILVVVANWMRKFLIRPEDYYDKPSEPSAEIVENHADTQSQKLNQGGDHHVGD